MQLAMAHRRCYTPSMGEGTHDIIVGIVIIVCIYAVIFGACLWRYRE